MLALHRQKIGSLANALTERFQQRLHRQKDRLARVDAMLRLLSPEHTIGRGYTITTTSAGRFVRSTADAAAGDELETRVRDGKIASVVNAVTSTKANGEPKRKPRK